MAENDRASSPEFQGLLRTARQCPQFLEAVSQFSERWARWLQQRATLKKREESLRRRKEHLGLKIQKVMGEGHTYIERHGLSDPSSEYSEPNGPLERNFKEVSSYLAQWKTFKQYHDRRLKTYDLQLKKLDLTYPILDIPDDILRHVLSRLSPSRLESLLSGNDGTHSRPNISGSDANERIPSIHGSLPPASPLSSAASGSHSSQAPSPEPQPSVGDPAQMAEDAHSSDEEEDNINAAGTFTATGGVVSSPTTEQIARNSSRPDVFIYTFQLPPDKLRKLRESADPPLQTIEFDEVYSNGNAPVKRFIVNYDDDYYILCCDKHNMNFDEENALQAAAKHLVSKKHGNIFCRTYWVAIRHFGIKVLNCDAKRQKMNNEAFMRAQYGNPIPQSEETTDHNEEIQRQDPPFRNTRSRRHGASGSVADPEVGGIYLVYWGASFTWRVSIVLPRDCFGDPSFSDIGLWGCLADTSLWDDVPQCYRTCKDARRITGWADGFEDAGDHVGERKYPVMRLEDDVRHLHKSLLKWVSATDLEAFDGESLASNRKLIPNYAALQNFLSERDQDRVAARSREEEDMVEDSSSEAMDLDGSESDISQPPEQHPVCREIRQEQTSPRPSTLDSPNYTEPGLSSTSPHYQSLQGAPMGSELWDQLIARPPDAWEQRMRYGLFVTSREPSKDATPIPELLPIPFPNLENREAAAQQELSSETLVSRPAGHPGVVPVAFMASHDHEG